MSEPIEPRVFRGTRDVMPEELLPREELVRRLVGVFQRYGFAPLETPAMEYLEILLGKYGEEGEKLIYRLAYKGGDVLALRYDLTVPLSRVVAMNPELPRPFKRYQIQPVWRADSPQIAQGRYREFIQCDVDTVGSSSMAADAENVAVVHDAMCELGFRDFKVRLNNRWLLRGLMHRSGVRPEAEAAVLRGVDKLDKVGRDGVQGELESAGLDASQASGLLETMQEAAGTPEEVLAYAQKRLGGDKEGEQGVRELKELLELAAALGVPQERLDVDLRLSRGLDYYTGPIYEVALVGMEGFGSLGGGGRYDDLMSVYATGPVPATGVSIGLSRVLAALMRLGLLERRRTPTAVLVMRLPETPLTAALELAAELRRGDVPAEVVYETPRLKKQFQLAERKGIPLAAIMGPDEIKEGVVNVKDLARGTQEALPRGSLAEILRRRLDAGNRYL